MATRAAYPIAVGALALLGGSLLAFPLGSLAELAPEDVEALAADDTCGQGPEAERCELALRQLRGELKVAALSTDAAPASRVAAAGDPADAEAAEDVDDLEDEDAEGEEEDDGPPLKGPFCCQNGQGLGYTDPTDVGGSCYPSSKPEPGSYCDSEQTCGTKCNGTWVPGFCGYEASEPTGDLCDAAMRGNKSLRAEEGSFCATEATCSSCNGTWCHYIKDPEY
mmetsp:Transcript_111940/g.361401  ORF Transcript_111940/g.361401 Transcript_111940/m.361401 type:complete len:223 (-) Transcript_111940:81-749(-)